MFTAIRSAFTENTRSSVGLNDLVSSNGDDVNNNNNNSGKVDDPQIREVERSRRGRDG